MKILRDEKGISVVEFVVVASIIVVVLGAVLAIIDSMLGNYLYQSRRIDSQDKARQGMVEMSKTIRQAERPLLLPINIPCNDLRFTVKKDVGGAEVSRAIRYRLDDAGDRVLRQEAEAVEDIDWTAVSESVVISNVVNNPTNQPLFTLSYIDELNQYNVRRVTIHLLIDTSPGTSPSPVELTTDVQLRSFAQYQ